ncbi:MAG TPA: hypothetical protein ENJ19_05790 [Gammaproteobacteria bacterium]|nr:hypothetical protein [Gammaproteobacteria bacterium]
MDTEQSGQQGAQASSRYAELGLKSDPFTSANNDFFADAHREQRLALMHHLAPYSQVLLITGEAGSGKTALLNQFAQHANSAWQLCILDSATVADESAALQVMAACFGVDAAEHPNEALGEVLAERLRELRQGGHVPMLLVDDAQLLPPPAWALLDKLTENSGGDGTHTLSVLLFAEPGIEERLSEPSQSALRSRIAHSFDVPPFSEADTGRYLRQRLEAAGVFAGDPFDAAEVRRIHRESGGMPGRIKQLAHDFLMAPPSATAKPGAAPLQHILAAIQDPSRRWLTLGGAGGVLVVLAVLAYALSGLFGDNSPPVAPPAAPGPTVTLPRPLGKPPGASLVQRVPAAQPEPVLEPAAPPPEITPPEVAPGGASAPPPPPEPAPPPAGPVPTTTPAVSKPKAGPKPATAPAPAPPKPVVAPNKAPPPADSLKGQAWLARQPSAHFTLQVLASSDEKKIRALIRDHRLRGKAAYFPVKRKGRTLYALVYGSYPSREAAEQGARKLPAAFAGTKPWIRPFAAVKKAAKSR